MNKDFEFFQEAILSLIGKLDFESSLASTFTFLRKHFPLEAITIDQYAPQQEAIQVFSVVTEKGVFHPRCFVPLDRDANHYMRKREQCRCIINMDSMNENSIAEAHNMALQQFFPFKPRGYLVGYLTLGNTWLGDLVFVGTRPACFTPHHERLLSMLLSPMAMAISNRMHLRSIIASKKQADDERDRLRRELRQLSSSPLIGAQQGLKGVMNSIEQLRGRDTPVLIQGETGTGKELVANAVQRLSQRSHKRFIRVNCGALPESLLDSELFGFERGSFTGAEKLKIGRFEQADGGTLFLDEVGELSLPAQVRLLRVLQDGIVERLGSTVSTPVNVRIIAATNRDLSLMRRQGTFREDLFHRLNVFPITVPPLRQRPEDIPSLVQHFVERLSLRMEIPTPPILQEGLEKACLYSWPGNVRELENIVERALILQPGGPVDISRHLPLLELLPAMTSPTAPASAFGTALEQEDHPLRILVDQRIAEVLGCLSTTSPGVCLDHKGWHGGQPVPPPPNMPGMTEAKQAAGEAFSVQGATPAMPNGGPTSAAAAPTALPNTLASLDAVMLAHIQYVLKHCRGKISGPGGAAEILGMHHSTLRHKMRKLGLHDVRNGL